MKIVRVEKIVSTTQELHEVFFQKLDLPNFYGRTLDSLWDCITGEIELPLTLIWRSFPETRRNLGQLGEDLLILLQDAEAENIGFKLLFD